MHPITSPRRPLALELALVVIVVLAVYLPGSSSYSLVDPWETHYGEVAREMLANHDFVHTDWAGNPDPEGFRSKPVLQFWAMAGSLRAFGLAQDGGYSGELENNSLTMLAIRMPFMLFGALGLVMMWWMLARLVDRRLAWLALLVVGSCPFYCLVSRQAMPDMPLVSTVIGAFAMFLMAVEDGDRPIDLAFRIPIGRHRLAIDARHVFFLIVGGFIAIQAIYYAYYFTVSPTILIRGRVPNPVVMFPLFMFGSLLVMSRDGWVIVRTLLTPILIGGIIAAIVGAPYPPRRPEQSLWRVLFDNYLSVWDQHAADRYVARAFLMIVAALLGEPWDTTLAWSRRVVDIKPITTMRQVYMLWVYAFLGLGILAKGPPGIGVIGLVGVLHVILMNRWRALWDGHYEIKRGLVLLVVIFLPWHIAMHFKDAQFVSEYLFTHILNRAAVGVDNSPGTFEMYTSQIGHGMWLWAGLLPAAFAALMVNANRETRAGRVRFHVGMWAIAGAFFFSIVQTKFHHYILPVVPALGLLVAFLLHDIVVNKKSLPFGFAVIGAGIVLLICRDLVFEPQRWIHMFVFRYDRPWPSGDPWQVDPSDGFLALGIVGALAILALALPWRRIAIAFVGVTGLAMCLWALHAYMPVAGKHWGQRDAIHAYYKQRTVYGQKLIYFGAGELSDDWRDVTDTWSFDTFIPDNLQVGQPMTIKVVLAKAEDERVTDTEVALVGEVSAVGDHDVTVKLAPGERKKLDPLLAKPQSRGRAPVRVVDADRLIAWQLYWRGENFWSQNEIMGYPPEMKTVFMKTDNVEFTKYLNDHTRAPLGRRYFLITEAGRALGTKSMVPTQHGRDTFEVVDSTSNKFTLVSFVL